MMRGGHQHPAPACQRGATLIVAMIMLVLISLVVINAFTLSSSNLRTATNLKANSEVIAAANDAIEQVISSNFYVNPQAQTFYINLNNDGTTNYTVNVQTPTCIRAVVAVAGAASDVELGTSLSSGSTYFTDWDIDASVTDAVTGGSVRIRQGVRVMMSSTQKAISCP
jgi:Tfp pilus assembly protein PilX